MFQQNHKRKNALDQSIVFIKVLPEQWENYKIVVGVDKKKNKKKKTEIPDFFFKCFMSQS